ncbi:MAG: exosortase/archaeosortase family protein [Phycisphaerae bacterium]
MHATLPRREPWRIQFDRIAQFKAAILTFAFLWFFLPTITGLVAKWIKDPDWSHGAIIPFFSIFLVSQKWDKIKRCPPTGAWLGLPIVLISMAFYIFNYTQTGRMLGAFYPYTMLLCLLGVIILTCGVPILRYVWLPWAYLLFAIPLPKGVYYALTDPLRRIGAIVAAAVLPVVPYLQVDRIGPQLEYDYLGNTGTIGLHDACSGMRSTITLCALGVAIAYITDRPWWHRFILIAACIPIATFCNLIRVLTTCLLHIFVDPKYAEGTYHTMLGLAVLLLAFGIFSALGWLLNNLFVDAESDEKASQAEAAG